MVCSAALEAFGAMRTLLAPIEHVKSEEVPSFHVFMSCSTGTRLVVMSIQDKLVCVRLVLPRCMFSMQLFLSEMLSEMIESKDSYVHKPLVYNSHHKRHPLIASCTSAECTHYCAVGSTSKQCVSMQLFCQTGQTRGNGVVGEWSKEVRQNKDVGRLGGV